MLTETELSEDLARLDQLLLAIPDPGMTLGELDGLLCAVIVGPEPIVATEWLPFVWGGDAFDDSWAIDLAELTELLTQRHNAMVHELSEGTFAPLYDIDDLDSDPLWEIWMQGFETGMGLRLKAWDRLLRRGKDDRAVDAAFGMVAMLGLSDPEVVQDDDDPKIIEARRTAPEAIPRLATQLYQAHAGRASVQPIRVTAIGRNDPCPCGSGKKYKRCCGA